LRTYATGFTLDDVNFDPTSTQKEDIVFKLSQEPATLEAISALSVPTVTGPVPLLSLGTVQTKANPTVITREGGKRSLSVSASVTQGYSVSAKNKELLDYANSIQLPDGYSWKTGGVNEENAKSVQSILQAMVVAFILILVTMVVQFHSYRQAVIVLLVIPLAVSSVFMIFALTGTPLSFPALIGVLSLFGIVVTNSMFIVDKINLNIRQNMPFNEAIADAGASRLEPIILTKLCTIFGLLPITLAEPLWRGLGGAIISGILVSSTIMLLFIPVVYYSWFKPQKNS
jgi:HAE1 family hydrophobic/amphiphilic exporter-1